MRVLIRLWESQTESSDEEDLNESSTNNDIADMGEITDNLMETENGKDSNDCPTVDFGSGVGIKIETSDSCENSLDGFPSLVNRNGDFGSDSVFTVPSCTSSTLRYPSFDAEMLPVGSTAVTSLTTNSASNSFDQSSFLDNANEQPMFELKNKRTDLMETLPFFNSNSCSNSKSDTFVAKGLSQQQRNDCEIVIDSSSDSEQSEQKDSVALLIADTKDPSPGSNSSLEFSALNDPSDMEKSVQQTDFNIDHRTMEVNNLEDVQQFLKMTETSKVSTTSKITASSSKNEDANAFAASILPELEGKTLMSPSISITPVTTATIANALGGNNCSNQNVQNLLNSMCLDRRPGIDVSLTPFSTTVSASSSSSSLSSSSSSLSTPTLPPSLTITPISINDDDRAAKERSNGSSSNIGISKGQKIKSCDDKVRIERKKKRKHDDGGPMGPPEKIPAKAEQLCKPVSVTIKPAEVIVPRSPSPGGAVARKFTVSPTQCLPLSLIGRVSPNSNSSGSNSNGGSSGGAICSNNNNSNAKSAGKSSNLSSASSSLGGSPKMVSSNVSPKHSLTSSSPKNVSSGSSGKPSMSALKQVVTSPSSGSKNSNNNNEPKSKSHKESSSREYKEKKNSSNGGSSSNISSSGHQSPKPKSSSSAKFNKTDSSLSGSLLSPQYDATALGSSGLETKLASSVKTKKGGLMAVVDRLNLNQISKSEDSCNNGSIKTVSGNGNGSSSSSSVAKDMKISAGVSVSDVKGQSATKGSNEYMIKHHNDGIKMTINRRAARDSLASSKSGSVKDSGAPGSDSPKHKTNVSGISGGSSSVGNNSSGSTSGSQVKKSVSTSKSSPVSGTSSTNKMSSSSGGSSTSGSKHSSKSSSNLYKSKSNHSTKGSHSSESSGSRKEKLRPSKTHSSSSSSISSDKSIFSAIPKRSSPSTMDMGGDGVEKQYKPPYQPTSAFPKNLANYQIPKISDRNKISGGGENEVKKPTVDGPASADGAAKDAKATAAGDSISSPHKMAFSGGLEERGILTEAAKNLNTYESSKPKQTSSGNENSLESVSGVTSQHQMTANCSMASVQSSDSIKLNL